jgi:hypothetical protein
MIRCVENHRLPQRTGSPDFDVCSVTAREQHYEYVSLSHSFNFRQRGVRISFRTDIVPVSPVKCAFPTKSLESFQERSRLCAAILPC